MDFERDVEAVVHAMVERALVDGLTEVVEEEEEREVRRWRDAWEEKIQGEVVKVQRMEQRDRRMQQEKAAHAAVREQQRIADKEAAKRRAEAAQREREALDEAERARKAEDAARPDPAIVEVSQQFIPWLLEDVRRIAQVEDGGRDALRGITASALTQAQAHVDEARQVRRQREFDAYVQARYDGRPLPVPSQLSAVEDDALTQRLSLHALHGRRLRSPPAPSAEAEAQRRIRLREEELAREAKYQEDIVRVQNQYRARRDRRRVQLLRERRDLVERRKTMEPKELLGTLHARLGIDVQWQETEETKEPETPAAPVQETIVDALSAHTAAGVDGQAQVQESEVKESSSAVREEASRPVTAATGSTRPVSAVASRPMTSAATTVQAPPARGLLVMSVDVKGPSLLASVLPLDVITHVNGVLLTSLAHYRSLLSAALPGDLITLTLYRHLTSRTDSVSVEAASDEPSEYPAATLRQLRSNAGFKASDAELLTADDARKAVEAMGAKPGVTVGKRPGKGKEGVTVGKVAAGSGAERAGLREGDVVVRVGREVVSGVDEWKEMSNTWQAGEVLQLRVLRGEGEAAEEVTVAVEMGAATAPKKNSAEYVRSLRRLAGMKYARDDRRAGATRPPIAAT